MDTFHLDRRLTYTLPFGLPSPPPSTQPTIGPSHQLLRTATFELKEDPLSVDWPIQIESWAPSQTNNGKDEESKADPTRDLELPVPDGRHPRVLFLPTDDRVTPGDPLLRICRPRIDGRRVNVHRTSGGSLDRVPPCEQAPPTARCRGTSPLYLSERQIASAPPCDRRGRGRRRHHPSLLGQPRSSDRRTTLP